ncbi:MAG: hypothetical protein GXP41_05130 [Chloroflexi bacterium]|nr:hypothetical protein [Chloroflexota bacterium]
MTAITITEILDDLRAADRALRKFEQRYWISSDVFYDLYSHGQLDDGQNLEDFSEWAGFYKIKQHREALLRRFSRDRIVALRTSAENDSIRLLPEEPLIEIAA